MRRSGLLMCVTIIVTCAAALSGCSSDPPSASDGDGESSRQSTPPVTNEDVIDALRQRATSWLAQTLPVGSPVQCANPAVHTQVRTTAADLAQACLDVPSTNQFALRVQNRSSVPLTLYFRGLVTRTVDAGGIADVELDKAAYGQTARFVIDTRAAITSAMISGGTSKFQSQAYSWRSCAQQVTISCLTSNLSACLPQEVHIGRFKIPLRRVGEVLGEVIEYAPLVSTVTRQAGTSVTEGQFQITRA